MDITDLEKYVTVREDLEAIKQLKARYCAVCDDNHNIDKITALFVDDGIWKGYRPRHSPGTPGDSTAF
jgi:hypothetical protein